MRVAVPHSLGRNEARRRLKARAHEIADVIPGGMAQVGIAWPGEDRMNMEVSAMGQQVAGAMDIEDDQVVFTVSLPPALRFFEQAVRGAIADKGRKLLKQVS